MTERQCLFLASFVVTSLMELFLYSHSFANSFASAFFMSIGVTVFAEWIVNDKRDE